MSKGMRVAAAVAVATVAAVGSGPAWADDTPGGSKAGTPCAPSGTSLALTAENHKFDKDCLAVTAGESFTIRFDNRDSDRHNLAILPSHTSTETMFAGDIVPGPKSTVYAVPNMKTGTYHFHCEVHPNLMNGTFVVAAAPAAAAPVAGAKPDSTPPPMTMDEKKPAATPTSVAAPAPKSAAAAPAATPTAPKAPATTATTRGAVAAGEATVAGTKLPRTGPADRVLVVLAGLALAAGGLSVLGGARSRA
jgi:LPXTG-motif cell wall-anchored protein